MNAEPVSSTKSNDDIEKDKAICRFGAIGPNRYPNFSEEWVQEKPESHGPKWISSSLGFATINDNDNTVFEQPDFLKKVPTEDYVLNTGLVVGASFYLAASLCSGSIISAPEGSTAYKNNIYLNPELSASTDSFIPELMVRDKVEILIEKCEKLYSFVNKNDIENYIRNNMVAGEVLLSGFSAISEIINDDLIKATIEYDQDPDEDFEGIYITAFTNSSIENMLEYLNKLEDEWLFKYDNDITKNLFINVMPL